MQFERYDPEVIYGPDPEPVVYNVEEPGWFDRAVSEGERWLAVALPLLLVLLSLAVAQ